MAPDNIDLVYRKVGDTHIFASKGIKGLVHVADTDLHRAYQKAFQALGLHVTHTYGVEARYRSETDFHDLEQKIRQAGPNLLVQATRATDVESVGHI